jgi:hypothetical protein
MPKKPKGQYHYAIQALQSRLDKVRKNPAKFKDADARIASFSEALDALRTNNLPARSQTLGEIFDEEEAAKRRAANVAEGLPADFDPDVRP